MNPEEFRQEVQQQQKFSEWAIVELFGHSRIAGLVSEATVGGCSFVRVDVPNYDGEGWLFTKLYGNGAIYAINITTEAHARRAVESIFPRPYVPRRAPELAPGAIQAEFDEEDY